MLFLSIALEVVALVGAKVHTLVPGAPPREVAIVVEGERIRSLCAPAEIPEKATRIDVSGLHITPGFIDALAYHDPEHDLLYTCAGVTLICDHGNDLARVLSSREPGNRSAAMGPDIVTAGALLDGAPPATSAAIVLADAAAAKDVVEHLAELQVQFLATHAHITPDAWRALITEGAPHSLRVFGPRPNGMDLASVLEAGPGGLVALDALLPEGRPWSEVGAEQLHEIALQTAKSGVYVIPTLGALAKDLDAVDPGSSDLARLGPNYASFWSNELALRLKAATPDSRKRQEVALNRARTLLLDLHSAGAKLVAGSAAPHPWLLPGEGLQRELAQWAAAGVPASACLAACTRDAAVCFGLTDVGTIEEGKLANLVVLGADPTVDVGALEQVLGVMRRGVLLDRSRLTALLEELKTRVAAAKSDFDQPIAVEAPTLPEGRVLLSGQVETISTAGRVAAESWAVVREIDDTLTFCGQRKKPAGVAQAELTINVRQRTRKGRLESFEVRANTQNRELVVRGSRVAEQWRVERRLDGKFLDVQAAHENLVAVDCDSITTPMLLATTREPGAFPIVRFDEGLQLEVVRWDMAINERGDHGFRTPAGTKVCALDTTGAIKVLVEPAGASEQQTTLLNFDLHGGAGVTLPQATLDKLRAAQEADAAAAAGEKR